MKNTKKIIFAFALLLSTTFLLAQDSTDQRVKDVQVTILTQCANAIEKGDYDKAALWYLVVQKLLSQDIVYQYEEVFPLALRIHVDIKSKFEKAATEILFWLKTKKM